jgi:large subunit ribosomal protein L21
MNYAITQTSGKQYLFMPGKWYDLDYIKKAKPGDFVFFEQILLYKKEEKIQIGKPFLENCQIVGQVTQEIKGKKITILKTKPKKNYTRTRGHRQKYTRINILHSIL